MFDYLYENKESIGESLGMKLIWERLDNKEVSRVDIYYDFDIKHQNNCQDAIKWRLDTASKFQVVFNDVLKEF